MNPRIKVLGDRAYQLVEEYRILWKNDGVWNMLVIPAGFICDGNSVPWFARPFVPGDWTLGMEAILAHDFIYHRKGRLEVNEHLVDADPKVGIWVDPLLIGEGFRRVWSRHDADRLFARLMRDAGVPQWRRRMAYRAVRAAFWHNWDEYPYDPASDE
jgi:hypothetical protein